jgi:hypothetical protein
MLSGVFLQPRWRCCFIIIIATKPAESIAKHNAEFYVHKQPIFCLIWLIIFITGVSSMTSRLQFYGNFLNIQLGIAPDSI